MNFVRVGNRIINLDNVTFVVGASSPELWVHFGPSDSSPQVFKGAEAKELWNYLHKISKPVI
jgi:hypothetical protein